MKYNFKYDKIIVREEMIYIQPQKIHLKNYTENEKNNLLVNMKAKVSADKFVITPREKNKKFLRTFDLNNSKVKDILLSLSINEFQYKMIGEQGDLLDVYKIEKELVNFHGEKKKISIYIKYLDELESNLEIISFHEDEK